jgi:hypothetical protein
MAITWRWTGYNMIFIWRRAEHRPLIYEAARIDGVPPWARFLYLTVPMLKPVILFTSVISTIGTLQLFDESTTSRPMPADLRTPRSPCRSHLQSQFPLHAELRLRRHGLLCHRDPGRHIELLPVHGGAGAAR